MSIAFPVTLTRTFEGDITGWGSRLSAVLSLETTTVQWGGGSMKVVTPGAATFEGINSSADSSTAQLKDLPVTGSTQYTLSVYVNAPAAAQLRLQANERDAANASVVTPTISDFTTAGGWERIQGTWTTGAATTRIRALSVMTKTVAQAITFYVDGFQLDQAATAQTYDGADGTPADVSANLTNTLKRYW